MALAKLKSLKSPVTSTAPAALAVTPGEKVKAVSIRMELNDGSVYEAIGDNANAIWHYQMECEQIANANGQMPSYLGPGMVKVEAK